MSNLTMRYTFEAIVVIALVSAAMSLFLSLSLNGDDLAFRAYATCVVSLLASICWLLIRLVAMSAGRRSRG